MIGRLVLLAFGLFLMAYAATEPLRQAVADLLLTFGP